MDDIITAEEALEAAKGLTFEKVWATLTEDWRQIRKSQEETDRQIQESNRRMDQRMEEADRRNEEANRRMEESQKRTDRILEKLEKNLGGLGNTLGQLTEAMFSPELCAKFDEMGFTFTRLGPGMKFYEGGRVIAEADFFLENGEYAMAVEIKTKLSVEGVDEHLARLARIRDQLDKRNDSRKLVGAVAGGVIVEGAMEYAHSNGLYVIVQSGDTVLVADTPDGFTLSEW